MPMWKQIEKKAWKKVRCKDCQHPTCTQCGRQVQQEFYSQYAPKTLEALSHFVCEDCRPITCVLCKQEKSREAYDHVVLEHSKQKARCQSCRFLTCVSCHQQESTLPNPSVAPKTQLELDRYRCDSCRFPSCQGCRRRPLPRERRAMTRLCKQQEQQTWTCEDCQQVEQYRRDLQR